MAAGLYPCLNSIRLDSTIWWPIKCSMLIGIAMLSPSFDRMIAHPRFFVQSSTNILYSAGRSDIKPVQFVCNMRKYSVLNPARLVKCFSQIIGLEHIFSSKKNSPCTFSAAAPAWCHFRFHLGIPDESSPESDPQKSSEYTESAARYISFSSADSFIVASPFYI